MREIKFRIWDSSFKHMLLANDIKFVDGLMIGAKGVNWDSKVAVMQYTGLKDKNGVEIYEGDLLKITTDYLNHCGAKTNEQYRKENYAFYEVFFHDNDCCDNHIGFQMNRRHTRGADGELQINPQFKPKTASNCEVIGNIYQNPELLAKE